MMKIGPAVAAAAVFAIASPVCAQDAVQWRVEDGGNGHWYRLEGPYFVSWLSARTYAESMGGHLVTLTSETEQAFAADVAFNSTPNQVDDCWLGAMQDLAASDFSEPAGGWRWVTGEPWGFTAWRTITGAPNGPGEFLVSTTVPSDQLRWVDGRAPHEPGNCQAFVEWSADCNGDGVVDYGQCREGSLPDFDGNNVPDCCEKGDPCEVGSYPVQWRVSDGGNGHWYGISVDYTSWTTGRTQAISIGGDLASLGSGSEWMWARAWLPSILHGYWLGGRQLPNSASPSSGWYWLTGEAIQLEWMVMDDNPCGASAPGVEDMQQDYLHSCCEHYPQGRSLGDLEDSGGWGCDIALRSLVEWSADCNSDGFVDKGQILLGQLVDSDQNGVPDVCEIDPCPGDVTNGGTVDAADLSILLAAWGTNGQGEFDTDLNGDGLVDGGDLALVLGGWGACP
jgi:hypothetical protein